MKNKEIFLVLMTVLLFSFSACGADLVLSDDVNDVDSVDVVSVDGSEDEVLEKVEKKTDFQKIAKAYSVDLDGLEFNYEPNINEEDNTFSSFLSPSSEDAKFTSISVNISKCGDGDNEVNCGGSLETLGGFEEIWGSSDRALLVGTAFDGEDVENAFFVTERLGEVPANGEYEDASVMLMYQQNGFLIKAVLREDKADFVVEKAVMQSALFDYMSQYIHEFDKD